MNPRRHLTAFGIAALLCGVLLVLPALLPRADVYHSSRATPPKQPNDWFLLQRSWPDAQLNRAAVVEAQAQARAMPRPSSTLDDEPWLLAGPSNVGGRITALAVSPANTNIVYAGAALGGVFKSVDGGYHYAPVFSDDFALSTGALALDPANPQKLWLGTGEANASGDSYGGNGVYVSTNGGLSWQHKGLAATRHIGKIAIDPTDSNRVFVAAAGELFGTNPERGLYRTTDGGDSWQRVLYLNDSTACIDVAINPQQPDTVYAVMWERVRRVNHRRAGGLSSGIWRSTNGGDTWSELTSGLPQTASVGRGGIALCPAAPQQLYAVYADHPGYLLGIYRSTDWGNSWQLVNSPAGSFYSSFGWYFGQIHEHPTDPNTLYVQGVNMFRSTDAGQSWSVIFGGAHVDHHAFWINPQNPQHMLTGHDGGVSISVDGGMSSQDFIDLPITQFYAITADPQLPERLYGGTQDNSTPRTLTGGIGDWDVIFGGDGFYCLVDPRSSDVIYGEAQYGYLLKSTDGGESYDAIFEDFDADRTNWCTPFVMNPLHPDELYLGTYRVWRTLNGGLTWSVVSPDLTNGPGGGNLTFGTITTLAISPADTSVIYAGTDDARVWVTTNRGTDWSDISAGLPGRWVTRVACHPDSAAVVYVSFSGYRQTDYLPHLFRSSDFGASWLEVGAGLPEGPINDVIVDPHYPAVLYAGTDFGVFYTPDLGRHWYGLGEGLPASSVFDLHFIPTPRALVAGTHGRSMWKLSLEGPLSAPRNLTLRAQGTSAVLTWLPSGTETAFTVYGARAFNLAWDSLATVTTPTWTDPAFSTRPGAYFYQVRGRRE